MSDNNKQEPNITCTTVGGSFYQKQIANKLIELGVWFQVQPLNKPYAYFTVHVPKEDEKLAWEVINLLANPYNAPEEDAAA